MLGILSLFVQIYLKYSLKSQVILQIIVAFIVEICYNTFCIYIYMYRYKKNL